MKDCSVLVTGGAGFIGSNLANELAIDNEVTVVDDLYLGTPENLDDSVELREHSVLDDDLPTDVDVLFHLAALSSMGMHEDNPQRGAKVNVEWFVNAVEQFRQGGGKTVVYATTSSIYGDRTNPLRSRWMSRHERATRPQSSHENATVSTTRTTTI
jgi:UDP-glucose 4-epimerase